VNVSLKKKQRYAGSARLLIKLLKSNGQIGEYNAKVGGSLLRLKSHPGEWGSGVLWGCTAIQTSFLKTWEITEMTYTSFVSRLLGFPNEGGE